MRVIFFGSADISLPTLQQLVDAKNIQVVAVVTQPDKPVGRKQILTATPVKALAFSLDIPVYDSVRELPIGNYDVGILVAYGRILKAADMDRFTHGIVNMHPSLLPKWRGPAPIQYAVLNRDSVTGISIMVLDEGMDTGPVIVQEETVLTGSETASDLHDSMAVQGASLLVKNLVPYVQGKRTPVPQNSDAATYTQKITREDGKLLSSDTAAEMDAKFRAFHPWPGVFCEWNKQRYKITAAMLKDNEFVITEIQPSGKQRMKFTDFLNGHSSFSLANISA